MTSFSVSSEEKFKGKFLLAKIWVRQAGQQGWQGRSIDVPTLTANIFAAPINKTNFHNKTGGIIDI
jgi:hypothetical protein